MAKNKYSVQHEEHVIVETNEIQTPKNQKPKYSKGQIVKTKKYEPYKDIINAVIGDGEEVTTDEVETRIDEFLKKEVR